VSDNNELEAAKKYLYDAISMILRRKPVRDLDERMARMDQCIADLQDRNTKLEAEKPAEDAVEVASSVFDCVIKNTKEYPGIPVSDCDSGGKLIQSFAESYHAKHCAECNKK
jgi:hypothetical protein